MDEYPTREKDTVFATDEFNQMYNEHVRRKEQIRNKIEAMTREKHFLEQLNPSDVAYMFQKKQEYILKKEVEDFEKKYESPQRKRSKSPQKAQKSGAIENVLDEIIQTYYPKDLSADEKDKLLR